MDGQRRRRRDEDGLMSKPDAIPKGFHTVTPHLVVKGGAEALRFYAKAFGAEEAYKIPGPGGSVVHAEMRVGDSMVRCSARSPRSTERCPPRRSADPR